MKRIQRVAQVFHTGMTSDGSTMTLYRLPSGEMNILDEDEAQEVLEWLFGEINKGLVGALLPVEPEHEADGFLETLGDYPENAIGAAMMAIDGNKPGDAQ